MWASKDNGSNINWANAKIYCENYRGGGYTDWRMPTSDELLKLYDTAKTYKPDCGVPVHLTELIRLSCINPWTSETRGSEAAYVIFSFGRYFWNPQSYNYNLRALPVRSEAGEISKPSESMIVAVARSAEPEQKISNSIGMKFVYIKPGTFMMGSPTGEHGRDNDEIQHKVTLTKGFYIQTTEVTQGQWQAVMGNNPSYFKKNNPFYFKEWWGDNYPIENVSWDDVQKFILQLNQKEGGSNYRLPTEAEWEYAARSGTTTPFNTGNCLSTDQANYSGDHPFSSCSKGEYRKKTVKAGSFSPNARGLFDMHGNVLEWCQDWDGDYSSDSVIDPSGPLSGSYRVIRGGGLDSSAERCRSAEREFDTQGYRYGDLGFRLVKDIGKLPKEITSDGRFIAYKDGTVLDKQTNLMWAARDNGSNINWKNAKFYCENYRGGDYTDWRMPTQAELAGLYDKGKTYKSDCVYDAHLTELIRLTCSWAWASETRGSDAAGFNFSDGRRSWYHQLNNYVVRALPVRSGK